MQGVEGNEDAHVPRRTEVALVTLVLLAALTARVWALSGVGLQQYDEGVYALSALGLTDDQQPRRLFPNQIRFSPPLYFTLAAFASQLSGRPADLAAIGVSIVVGLLTVLLVWWVARSWFGPAAGLAAATLLALNEYHIAFSRAALTDVTFAFTFVLAVTLLGAAFTRSSLRLALMAGLATGLAWNTKYHGWFAIVVGAGTIALAIAAAWVRSERWPPVRRLIVLLGVAGVVAGACYVPWALYIESQPGGYQRLLGYQSTLINSRWIYNLGRHVEFQSYFEGPLNRSAGAVAVLVAGLASGADGRRLVGYVVVALAMGWAIGTTATAILLTLLAVPMLVRRGYGGQLLLVWLAFWFVMTPLYAAYARLLMPFIVATHLAASLVVMEVLRPRAEAHAPRARPGGKWPRLLAAAVVLIAVGAGSLRPAARSVWGSTRSPAEAAAAIASRIEPAEEEVVVIGEPPIAYYLTMAGRHAFGHVDDLDYVRQATTSFYLVTGLYTGRSRQTRDALSQLGDRMVPVATFAMTPGDVRLLDDGRAETARAYAASPDDTYTLTLYRVLPASQVAGAPR